MADLAGAFAQIAAALPVGISPFRPGKLCWPGTPVTDEGGSIVTPSTPEEFDCSVQVDQVTEAMRAEAGYTDKDLRLLILAPDLGRAVDTAATVEVLSGPHLGTWSIQSEAKDVMGFAYDGRGRMLAVGADDA